MDSEQTERQALTTKQREWHERFCRLLKNHELYRDEYAVKLARALGEKKGDSLGERGSEGLQARQGQWANEACSLVRVIFLDNDRHSAKVENVTRPPRLPGIGQGTTSGDGSRSPAAIATRLPSKYPRRSPFAAAARPARI
jgi:hypothetical protein